MEIYFEAQTRKGEPIEVAIAEAVEAYRKRFGRMPVVVRINVCNPASVDVPQGVLLERVKNVLPGAARAGGESVVW